jgi:predicted nucleic acid-binding protein
MMVVIDPSAAIEISLYRTYAEDFIHFIEDALWVGAPDLFISESTNVFWKYHQFEDLPIEICEKSLERTIQLVDEFYPTNDLYLEALSVSFQTSHPAYDSMYLVLARRNNATLLTRDRKLYQLATELSIKNFFPHTAANP